MGITVGQSTPDTRQAMKFLKNHISKFYLQNICERPHKKVRTNLLKKWNKLKPNQNFYNKMGHHAKHLCDQGYTIIPEFFKGGVLEDLKSDFERFVSDKEWDKYKNIQLHMIGKLQSNKAKKAVKIFDYIHSLDNIKLAQKISFFEKEFNKKIKLFIQVNVGDENQKSGILLNNVDNF